QIPLGVGRPDNQEREDGKHRDNGDEDLGGALPHAEAPFCLLAGLSAEAAESAGDGSFRARSMIAPGRAVTTTPSAISKKTRVWPSARISMLRTVAMKFDVVRTRSPGLR